MPATCTWPRPCRRRCSSASSVEILPVVERDGSLVRRARAHPARRRRRPGLGAAAAPLRSRGRARLLLDDAARPQRAQGLRAPAGPPGHPRPAHRPAQPRAAASTASTARSPGPGATTGGWRCSSSTSTTSRSSTTASATAWATACWSPSASASPLALRPGDTVARFGGDEFVVLCEDVVDQSDAVAVAERVDRAVERTLRDRRHRGVRGREHRHRLPRRRRRRSRDADPRRRRRHVPGQGPRPGPVGAVRQRHARQRGRSTRHRDRPAPRPRAPRAARLLPADHRPDDGHHRRRRGAAALGAPRARPAQPRRLHHRGRGDRAHRAHRRLGARPGLPPGAALAGRDAGACPRCACR